MRYKISNGVVTAEVESKGGELVSWKKNGIEYMWQGDKKFWGGRAPLLFPVVGRVPNGEISVGGKVYPMRKHGFLRDMELSVTEQTDSSITLQLTDNEETHTMFPWKFSVSVTHTLKGDEAETRFCVENKDDTVMYFGLGGHPGFNLPLRAGEKFSDYQLIFEQEEILKSILVNPDDSICETKTETVLDTGRVLPLHRKLFHNDAMIFENLKSTRMDMVHKDTKAGIRFRFGEFPIFALWTQPEPIEAPYVCLEPWFSMGFRENEGIAIEEKHGILSLKPGEKFTASYSAEIIE